MKESKYTKWRHVMFVESWGGGTPAYQLFSRENRKTGLVQYKKVKVGDTILNLAARMNILWDKLHQTAKLSDSPQTKE